jgi:hypothetical protein
VKNEFTGKSHGDVEVLFFLVSLIFLIRGTALASASIDAYGRLY